MQQRTHHVGSGTFFCIPPDDTSCKLTRTIKICAESATLARWKVPDISEKKFREVSPGRLKNQDEWRGVQRGIDAVQDQGTILVIVSATKYEVGGEQKEKILAIDHHTSSTASSLRHRGTRN